VELGRDHNRSPPFPPYGGRGGIGHLDDLVCVDHGNGKPLEVVTSKLRLYKVLPTDQHDLDRPAGLAYRRQPTLHLNARGVLSAHGVNRDPDRPPGFARSTGHTASHRSGTRYSFSFSSATISLPL